MKIILLLFSLAFLPLSTLATCTNDDPNQLLRYVLDTDGHPLNKNTRYFINSAIWGAGGGGVFLANIGYQEHNVCPKSVVQSPNDLDNGLGVYFKPKDLKRQKIVESSPVNIIFYLDTYLCANLTVWKVDHYPKPAKLYTLSTGAKKGNPLDVNSWFQIKSLGGSTYKLVFCPYGEEFTCQNIGIVEQNGYRRLVLTKEPKAFVFIKDKRIEKAEA
ncbi:latex serine proteinase inhibitor-like [Lycium barbarum]|uniref:latex serine proteinase inhibitor-like n=1 Tax=Lycium barbarum TaxID=112863 RepID=UPI00293EB0A3|nr:latex serine proteinase inhibitor-like [Lycium barbarum]